MSRICFDSMLFIYMLDGHPAYSARVLHLLSRTATRGDALFTSYLTLGEVVAGAAKSPNPANTLAIRSTLDMVGFSYLPFGEQALLPFGRLRSQTRVKTADAINLACAAAAGMDLFLTGDKHLIGLHVPGIQFIADFNTDVI